GLRGVATSTGAPLRASGRGPPAERAVGGADRKTTAVARARALRGGPTRAATRAVPPHRRGRDGGPAAGRQAQGRDAPRDRTRAPRAGRALSTGSRQDTRRLRREAGPIASRQATRRRRSAGRGGGGAVHRR